MAYRLLHADDGATIKEYYDAYDDVHAYAIIDGSWASRLDVYRDNSNIIQCQLQRFVIPPQTAKWGSKYLSYFYRLTMRYEDGYVIRLGIFRYNNGYHEVFNTRYLSAKDGPIDLGWISRTTLTRLSGDFDIVGLADGGVVCAYPNSSGMRKYITHLLSEDAELSLLQPITDDVLLVK